MKARYNVIVQSDHLVVMQKVGVVWANLTTADRMMLHELIDLETQNVQNAVPVYARTKEESDGH